MRAPFIVALALLGGAAFAQGGTAADNGAMCRSFCDADAKTCRKDATDDASNEVDPLLDFRGPRADKDDFTLEKHEQAVRAAGHDRFTASQKCSQARMACHQRCAPAAPAAASASH